MNWRRIIDEVRYASARSPDFEVEVSLAVIADAIERELLRTEQEKDEHARKDFGL